MSIAGAGSANDVVATVGAARPDLRLQGLLEDVARPTYMWIRTFAGWAFYNPAFAMQAYNGPLKIKDHLAAELRAVSTLPAGAETAQLAEQHTLPEKSWKSR